MKSILFLLMLFLSLNISAQNFYRENFNKSKTYILLANPTVANIETIKFLTDKKLLKINSREVRFVGVYHKNQNHNFGESIHYIQQKGMPNFYFHEFRSPLNENKLFERNELSDELELLFENSAGVFFFGGPDIPPSVYNEKNTLSVITDPERHYFELTFLFHLLGGFQDAEFNPLLEEKPDYFVTGFCLGLQTMNVATGGTLIQDIPEEVYDATTPEAIVNRGKENMHRNYWHKISDDPQLAGINFHSIKFTQHPFFGKKVKVSKNTKPLVYSSHHQAVEKTGKDMEITANSSDGKIVEGLAHSKYPNVFSVQFHPEVPALYENGELLKIQPGDVPQTYHQMIGSESFEFHKKYWKYISKTLKKASRK
mgnify:CR=1 FL=1